MNTWRQITTLTAIAAVLPAAAGYAESRVGVTSAVNPSAAGAPPGLDARQLTVGSDIVFRERLITTTDGQAQILFLDQSSLLIGPNSTVVIDEFVYDPATNRGNIAATLTQGSFRYIGGKLSKQGNATLKTPVATLGIRGSDITVDYDASQRRMDVVTTHGLATLTTATDSVNLRGGFGLTVSGNDHRPPVPSALTAARIAAANRPFEGLAGRNAGAGKPPTNSDVAASGLSGSVEAKGLASTEPGAGGVASGASPQIPFTPGPNDMQQRALVPQRAQASSLETTVARTDRTLNGYVGGISVPTILSDDTTAVVNTVPGDMTIRTVPDATGPGRVSASFLYGPAPDGPNSTERRFRSAAVEFGNPPGSGPASQSRFVSDQVFEASQSADRASGKAKINGIADSVSAVLVSVPISTPVGVLTGDAAAGPACACQFVTWGTWSAELRSTPSNTVLHQVPNGFWTAGSLPDIGDRPAQGIATFSGTAIGQVSDNGQLRAASGSFTNVFDFAQRSGRLDIRNFDGNKSFGGTVTAPGDWRSYSGALSGSALTGSANGAFYGTRDAANRIQLPSETAGNFAVRGNGYDAGGVFMGRR